MKAALLLALLLALPLSGEERSLKLSGVAQLHARGFAGQSGPVADTPDPFLLRRAEVRVAGTLNTRLSGYVSVDLAKQLNGTNARSSNVLQEVVLSYRFAPKTFVDAGQFKLPIGYEGDLVSSAKLQNVERALFFQARDPQGGGQGDVRDAGIRVRTTAGPFELQLGAFNGLGERQNTTSLGDEQAFAARVVYQWPGVKGLKAGVSGGHAAGGAHPSRSLGSAFVAYQQGRATVQTEYAAGKHRFEPRGWYGHVGWSLTPKIETTARYDVFDFDHDSAGGTTVRDAILGVNYLLRGNNAKVQANVIHRDGGAHLAGLPGLPRSAAAFANSGTQIRVNFQVGF